MSLEKSSVVFLPLGSILDRYLVRAFLKTFILSLLCATFLYFIVDFFDRIDNFLKSATSLEAVLGYFLYKIPLFISRVFGFAALFSTLFCLGTFARNHEITAIRASGTSLGRISMPLILISILISLFTFFWNEALVPIFTRKSQYIYKTEVRKKPPQSLIGSKDIWLRGEGTFIRVDRFDAKRSVLEGVTIYLLDRDFSLKGLIEVPWARWDGSGWEPKGAREWLVRSTGQTIQWRAIASLPLTETPEDLTVLARDPEEFSFFELQKQVADLKAKGIGTTEYEVDLQVKLALPLVSPLMVLLAIPFAIRHRAAGGMALCFGLTMLISFGYWLLLAFSVSLGHSGVLLPWVAAWLPNLTLALVGLFFSTAEE